MKPRTTLQLLSAQLIILKKDKKDKREKEDNDHRQHQLHSLHLSKTTPLAKLDCRGQDECKLTAAEKRQRMIEAGRKYTSVFAFHYS
ncbi:hypothetical protein Tcan_01951 [Toxocara canis]|uniref:Uncharacterized protein n=1 Tax=Toxocara canis TaxID=6265 RepID=A0A0B2UPR7_TOXCA|nr:hypothetical protein Tcan_01951 [Toxocara canis]